MKRVFNFWLLLSLIGFLQSCGGEDGDSINVFSVEDDKELGAQMDQYIRDSTDMIVLDRNQYPQAYAYLDSLTNEVLISDDIRYRDEFVWEVSIIQNDSVLNAFATPGGYLYFYTGLIKYLQCEDHFTGVLGHEIAHSDRRHSTEQLTKTYGIQLLFDVVFGGDAGALAQITQGLLGLKFSRNHETEADEFSVRYLCDVNNIEADGAAGFFQRLIEEGQTGGTPEFLSTHPSPENRVQNIEQTAVDLGCGTSQSCRTRYQQFQNSLP